MVGGYLDSLRTLPYITRSADGDLSQFRVSGRSVGGVAQFG